MPQQYYPTAGFGSVPEYQASGMPWTLTATVSGDLEINFPLVTRSLTILNHTGGADLKIAFSRPGMSSSNYFTLKANETFQENVRVAKVFLNGSTSVSIFAGLTGINTGSCPLYSSSIYSGV